MRNHSCKRKLNWVEMNQQQPWLVIESFISNNVIVNIEEAFEHPEFIALHLHKGVCIFMGVGALYPVFAKVVDIIS